MVNQKLNAHLPKVQMPHFDRKTAEWRVFIDIFNQMIHTANIKRALKIQYLKGDKANNHLSPTAENYNSAYELLTKRNENKRILFGELVDNILHLPKLYSELVNALKNMHDTIWECLKKIWELAPKIGTIFSFICLCKNSTKKRTKITKGKLRTAENCKHYLICFNI